MTRKKTTATPKRSAADIIKDAKLPERSVPVCMRADLVAEFELLERQLDLAERRPDDSLAGNGADALAEKIEALRAEMAASTVEFKMRAMPRPEWKAFVAKHPPRKLEDESPDPVDAYIGVNRDTFGPASIRESTYEPVLDDEVWDLLLGEKLTDAQFDELANMAWFLNRGKIDVPFSRAASERTRNSSPE